MQRFMRFRLVAAMALAVALPALAIQPFVIRDIRVEGVQRTEAATGFYSDVRLEAENDILIVFVQERPAIAQIDIEGAKEFTKDNLKDGLKQAGISEERIYDKTLRDNA